MVTADKFCRTVEVSMYSARYRPQISGSLGCVQYSGPLYYLTNVLFIPRHYPNAPVGGPLIGHGSHDKHDIGKDKIIFRK